MKRFVGSLTILSVMGLSVGASALLLNAAPAPGKRFTLVYNVNNAGYFDVCGCKHKEVRQGSITRRSSFLKQLRATGRELCLVDGGSSLFAIEDTLKENERAEAIRKAQLIVECYNRMGYRAMAVGSSDLLAGLDVLKSLEKQAKFPFLSANLVDKATNQLLFKPHVILETNGVRLGVIGLTLNTMSQVYLTKVAPNAEVTDPVAAAEKAMAELDGKVDLVLALSHLREEANFDLVTKLKGLELMVDPFIQYANHHTWIKEEEWLSFKGDTVFLRGDGQGARLGVVDIEIQRPRQKLADEARLAELEEAVSGGTATAEEKTELQQAKSTKGRFSFTRVSLEPHHRTDPEIDRLIEEWKKNVDLSQVARLESELPRKSEFLTVTKCQECHPKQYENWKTTKHAKAFASLVETNDQHRYDCIGCHALGYGEAFLDTRNIGSFGDVQCESCHGTNPKHAVDPQTHKFSRTSRADCLVCHNKEHTRSEFNYAQARPKIQCPKS